MRVAVIRFPGSNCEAETFRAIQQSGGEAVYLTYREPSLHGADAVILPGGPPFTIAFFSNDEMDRVENYDSMDLAVFRADEIKVSLMRDQWVLDP